PATAPTQTPLAAAPAAHRVPAGDTLADADPADAVIVANLLSGGADEVRGHIDALAKQLTEGGVISVAVAAAPFLSGGAGGELERQSALHGVGTDLVLRNAPPLRVHRLRFT